MDGPVGELWQPAPLRLALRPLARAFLPEATAFSEHDWQAMAELVGGTLAGKPPRLLRQLGLFVRIIGLLAVLRHRRRLDALPPDQLRALLESLERSPLLLIRRGVWGLRTLIFMGYYTRPEAAATIGYRATAAGWEARR
ncbi:MAG: hypothetical protein ABR551_08840 [Gemmatimonadales bacterium]